MDLTNLYFCSQYGDDPKCVMGRVYRRKLDRLHVPSRRESGLGHLHPELRTSSEPWDWLSFPSEEIVPAEQTRIRWNHDSLLRYYEVRLPGNKEIYQLVCLLQ